MNTALYPRKELIFESTRKKVDSVGTTGIFHLIILNTLLQEGGGGRRLERRYSRGATVHKYSSIVQGGNSSQTGSKIQTMSECISSL
jgi:hypothetical protein